MREERTEVLVVGAGPVGLFTAVQLAEAGIDVKIIDQEERTTARSYACALHPGTLRLLEKLGLSGEVVEAGRRIKTVAFYDQEARRAEIKLSELGGDFPFLLLLPQNAFENLLEQRLRQAGVAVRWNHRFDDFSQEEESILATVEELGGTAIGYIVPHWESVVKSRIGIQASFLIGADGFRSLVRQRLGVETTSVGTREFFAAYEFESETKGEDELRVVLDRSSTNVLWPLPGDKYRWTFQVLKSEGLEFPEKERRAIRFQQKTVDEEIRRYVEKVAGQRAPWFKAGVKEVNWCTDVVFEHRAAKPFGRGRCWLAGDAAHQTGPAGVQSMNVGLTEGAALAKAIQKILKQDAAVTTLGAYDADRQHEWLRLLGLGGGLKAGPNTNPWVAEHRSKILPCLPGSGTDLEQLARQLGLDF